MKADGFVRAREGAEYLGIGESLFWKLAKVDPTFPVATRLGLRVTLFRVVELEAWALSKRKAANEASIEKGKVKRKA